MAKKRERLADALLTRGLATDEKKAGALVLAGEVSVDGVVISKPGTPVAEDAVISLKQKGRYVSRAGDKLKAALDAFGVIAAGKVCADIGAATGGFSDVLLQDGAARVYAIDVGYGDLHWKVRSDPRLVLLERTNVRNVSELPEPIELVVIDVSFISTEVVVPTVAPWLSKVGEMVVLLKPQFEAKREQVGEGGIILDPAVREEVILRSVRSLDSYHPQQLMLSPVRGTEGNREFLLHLVPSAPDSTVSSEAIKACVAAAHSHMQAGELKDL